MATLASLTDDVYDMLYGNARVERPQEDTLATAVSGTTDTEWRFDTPSIWKRNDYAEDTTAGELIILAEDHPTGGSDVTVRRAQRGTTALASYSQGDVFYRNPPFPRYLIERFIEETIKNHLHPHVWMWGETTVTYTSGTTVYELPTDCTNVVSVYQVINNRFYPFDNETWRYVPVVNSTESTNGNFLRLFGVRDANETVYVTYKQKPTTADYSTMSDEVASLVPWRVVGKLLAGARVGPTRVAPGRVNPRDDGARGVKQDAAFFDVEFRRMRKDINLQLRQEWRDMGRKRNRRSSVRSG